MTVLNSNGQTVRTFTGTTSVSPLNFTVPWDGRNQSGQIVPDGVYTVALTSKDAAGNVSLVATNTIVVLTVPPALTVTTNTPTIYGDAITLTSTISVTIPAVAPLLAALGAPVENRRGTSQPRPGRFSATMVPR